MLSSPTIVNGFYDIEHNIRNFDIKPKMAVEASTIMIASNSNHN